MDKERLEKELRELDAREEQLSNDIDNITVAYNPQFVKKNLNTERTKFIDWNR